MGFMILFTTMTFEGTFFNNNNENNCKDTLKTQNSLQR